jgi:hypothetical protein
MMDQDVSALSVVDRQRFNIDCASVLLPVFEARYPKDRRPRNAITAAKAFMDGKITAAELAAATDQAWEVVVDFFQRHRRKDRKIQTDPASGMILDPSFCAAQAACVASSADPLAQAWTWLASAFEAAEIEHSSLRLSTSARRSGWQKGRARARKLLLKYLAN